MNLSSLDTPALLIDQDKVARNIELAIRYAGGVDRLRPHVKTHKLLEVAQMQIAAGLYQFKCATIPEAELLGRAGAKDVLLAYPIQGPKIQRFLQLMNAFPETSFSVLIDNVTSASKIEAAAMGQKTMVRAFVDLNVGQGRTGILPEAAPALIAKCLPLQHLEIVGLHAYDGHLHMASLEERTMACREAFARVATLRSTLEKAYARAFSVVAGGSPTFRIHAAYHDVVCSPGTFIFWDQGYGEKYQEQDFEIAAQLATRVISQPNENTYCLDLGHKSVGSEMPFPRVALAGGSSFQQVSHSEEHLVITSEAPNLLSPGEVLLATPYHICPTVALYDRVTVIRDGHFGDEWEVIARNRKLTI